MAITEADLKQVYNEKINVCGGILEDYFAPLYISEKHNISLEEALEKSVFGNNDYGIDGYFIDKSTKNLYLYQFKWSKSHDSFKPSYERFTNTGMNMIFGNPKQDTNLNKTIRALKYELNENKEVINRIYFIFIFNGDTERANNSITLDHYKEELENKYFLIDDYFGRTGISFSIDYKSNNTGAVTPSSVSNKTNIFPIEFTNITELIAQNGETLSIGLINLNDLHKIYLQMNNRLFEKNIRASLSPKKSPNRAIKDTLKNIMDNKLHCDYFTFNHNGISIYAENLESLGGAIHITEPRVLNGAQTISTFSAFMAFNKDNNNLKKNISNIEGIKVIAKIITKAKPEFVTNVTISNNKQNPVAPWHLRASDLTQCSFQEKFKEHGEGIHYERLEGAFKNMTDEDRLEMRIFEGKKIDMLPLAQTFLVFQGNLHNISNMRNTFESEKIYKETFNQNYLKADFRKIVLMYKINFVVKKFIKEIKVQGGEENYWWIGKSSFLIWALIIQGMLNNKNIENILDEYGNDLNSNINFIDCIKAICLKKVSIILFEIGLNVEHKKSLENSPAEYSFLKSSTIFKDSMVIAKEKFNWERIKSL